MKRFFALAALVLGLAACQTEPEGLDVNVGGEVDSYVTVSLPETTRANSALGAFDNVVTSGDYTIRYIFQVFYGEAESLATRQVIYTDNDQVSFPVRLVPNRHYNFVVWADVVPEGDKTMNEIVDYDAAADYHYNTANLKDIQIIDVDGGHEWEEMDETRDAFTGQFDTAVDGDQTTYNGAKNISFTLTRPFAKLRVITTDMEQLNDLVITPTSAEVEYTTDLYSSFNAFAGAVNESAKLNKTHETFEIKAYEDNATDESMVLFTDYLFAADQDEVVNFTLAVYDQDDVIIGKETNFNTPIPARRNYLTTISGNILTDGNKIEVTVTDEFANAGTSTNAPYYQETISSVAELLAAIDANNGEYILISDLDVNGVTTSALAATRAAGNGTTINLNGYTITLKTNLTIPEGKTVIINNDPVDDAADKLGAVVNDGGKIINNGTLNIEGGNFGENTIQNNGKVNVNGDDVHDNAIVNGEDAVVGSFIYSAAELQTAVEAAVAGTANEFTLAADIEGLVTISQKEDVNITINGAGFEFDGTFTIDGNNRNDGEESVTFYNINFNAENATGSMNFIYAPNEIDGRKYLYAHNIIVDQCTFTGGETVVGVRAEQTYGVTIKNSTFTGMHSIGQFKSANKFTHLEKVTAECLGGVNFNNKAADVVLDGCRITATDADGYCVRTDHTAGSSLTIKNSTLTGYCPIILRECSAQASIKLENNTLVKGGLYDINVMAPGVMPQNEGIEEYIVYPREVYVADGFYQTSTGYTIKNAAENSTITLADDVNGTISIEKVKNITIEGNENTNVRFVTTANSQLENVTIKNAEFGFVTGAGQKNGAFVVIDAAAQIDNLVIEGCNIVGDGNKNSYGIYGQNPNASIVVKDCNFANVGYAIQTIAGGGYKSLVVEECTFDNIISWAIIPQYGYTGDLTVNKCEFVNSKGGLIKTGAFNGTFTFTNNALTSCTGHDGADSKWFEVNASAATKVVSGNVKDGVEWVPGTAQGLK